MTTAQTAPSPSAATDRGRGPGSKRRSPRRAEKRWGLLLAAPATFHVALWTGIPVVAAIVLSFASYDMVSRPEFIGIGNYLEIFRDEIFWRAVSHNLILAVVGIPISMIIALVLAVMLNQGLKGEGIFRTMVFLPHVTATVAVAMIWLWIYAPTDNGLANMALGLFGFENSAWLTNPNTSLMSVLLVTIWQGIGLKMLIYLASMQGISATCTRPRRSTGPARSGGFGTSPCRCCARPRSLCWSPRSSGTSRLST